MQKREEREARNRREQDFYAKCSEILKIEHVYHTPFSKRTRWNARTLGNGRFPGFGTIQSFGSGIRIMCFSGTYFFRSEEEVFQFLRSRNC